LIFRQKRYFRKLRLYSKKPIKRNLNFLLSLLVAVTLVFILVCIFGGIFGGEREELRNQGDKTTERD
jgi:hypothetical protein